MLQENFSRKEFLHRSLVIGSSLTVTGSLIQSCSNAPAGAIDRELKFLTFEDADMELEKLGKAHTLLPYGDWNPSQILLHCAQSIYFSIQGYPENKSALFQNTLGKLAFWNFERKGKMSHDLNAPIPNAPALEANVSVQDSILELRKSIEAFINHKKDFAPHFAYGNLTKKEYELAHAMHIANHLSYVGVS